MKHLLISYRMYCGDKTTADSITLPVLPEYADKIMAGGAVEHLDILLDRLALLQGYATADALTVYNQEGDNQDNDPVAGAEDWDAGDEDWIPGGAEDD